MKLRVLIGLILLLLVFPKSANAEIATVKDWIGLFPVNARGVKNQTFHYTTATPSAFLPSGDAWLYTSNCSQTAPVAGTAPKLADNLCNFIVPLPQPPEDYYLFRMYANDMDENTPDALIATSNTFNFSSTGGGGTTLPAKPSGRLYRFTGNLIINSDITVNETGVIFVDGNLTINTNLLNNNATKGLVFVVKGEIFIQRDVTKVNAFLIAHGKSPSGADMTPFCTAYDVVAGCNDYADNATRKYLEINGSIISLSQNPGYPADFARKKYDAILADKPAETINYEAKYLVIMKDIFSRDLRIWREIQ